MKESQLDKCLQLAPSHTAREQKVKPGQSDSDPHSRAPPAWLSQPGGESYLCDVEEPLPDGHTTSRGHEVGTSFRGGTEITEGPFLVQALGVSDLTFYPPWLVHLGLARS